MAAYEGKKCSPVIGTVVDNSSGLNGGTGVVAGDGQWRISNIELGDEGDVRRGSAVDVPADRGVVQLSRRFPAQCGVPLGDATRCGFVVVADWVARSFPSETDLIAGRRQRSPVVGDVGEVPVLEKIGLVDHA